MDKELQYKLFQKFPELFQAKDWDITQSNMPFGIETGDGWYSIIETACEKIQAERNRMKQEHPEEDLEGCGVFSQIKEKYGTLRMYTYTGTDAIFNACDQAETESETTCEQCGASGLLRGQYWFYTACNNCHEQKQTSANLD